MATVTLADLLKRVRKWLEDEPWETTLGANISAAYTTFTVPDGTQWSEGDRAEFPDGDVARVTSISGNTLTAKGGHDDTTAAAHTAGDVILKNPTFFRHQIVEALTRAAQTLWPFGYVVKRTTITPVALTHVYALPADFLALVDVRQLRSGASAGQLNAWINYGRGSAVGYDFNADTVTFASGKTLELSPHNVDNDIIVKYAASPVLSASTTDVEDGLMADFVIFDACKRLLEMKEVERVAQEDIDHGDIGVGAAARARDAGWFDLQAKETRLEFSLFLKRTAPIMGTWRR